MTDAPLMLSVSGLRGLIGLSLTPDVAARYAAAYGTWLRQQSDTDTPHVVLGRDSRPSGPMIEAAVSAGLMSVGCRVTTLGIVTTPTVGVMIDHLGADGGMVMTASHNPTQWNGIKALTSDGVAPPKDQAEQIIRRFRESDVAYASAEIAMQLGADESANATHIDRVLAAVDVEAIRSAKLRVVLDSVHGAGGPATGALLEQLGVDLVHLYAETTGQFPHTPEPTADNLTGLCDAVRAHGADLGLAQDPDADRLALVDENGKYIGEEYTLVLAVLRIMQREPGATATNLSTSRMIDDIASRFDQVVHRTAVGEANVAQRMQDEKCVIGGEGNGGVIWPRIGYVRDSLAGAALVLELLATAKQSLTELVADVPAYSIVKEKLPIQPGMADAAAQAVRETFGGERMDEQDGIRVDLESGWVHVRPSNTEPILRIIAEARTQQAAEALVEKVRSAIG